MARVVHTTIVESCLDSSVVKEFELDRPLDRSVMRAMARKADLLFYPDFPRPYFRIERSGHYVIQGVLGNTHFRVTFSQCAKPSSERTLRAWIEAEGEKYHEMAAT